MGQACRLRYGVVCGSEQPRKWAKATARTNRGEWVMATRTEIQAVLKAIEQHEGPQPDGAFDCTNDVIVEATGLDKAVVASALHDLWKSDHIEGVLTLGGVKPYLVGIVRVLPGRDRLWGRDGRYKAQP